MNPARLRELFVRNRVALGVLGAAAVAALAWRARSSKGGDVAAADSAAGSAWTVAPAATSATGGYSAGTGYSGAYDSSASDVYGALQPALENIQNLLQNTGGTSSSSAAAVPTVTGYFASEANPVAVHAALSDGTRRWVDLPAYLAAGKPNVTTLPANDGFWKRTDVSK